MAENDPGANQMVEKMMEFLSQQNITLDKSEKLLRQMAEHTGAVAEEAAKATGKIKDLFKYTDDTVDRYKELVKYAKKRSEQSKEEIRDAKKAHQELQALVNLHEEALKSAKGENRETKQMQSNLTLLRKTMQGLRTEGNLLDSEMGKVGEAFEVCARNAKDIAKAMAGLSQRGAAMKGMMGVMSSLGVGRGLNQRIEKRAEQITDITDKINEARSMRKQAAFKSMSTRREGIMSKMGPMETDEDYNVFAKRMGFKGDKAKAFIMGEKNIASGAAGGAEYTAAMSEGGGGLAAVATALEGGMTELLAVAPEIIIPLEILAEVIKALISIFDTYVKQNQAMEKQLGPGGLFTQPGQGAGEAFARARWALMPSMDPTRSMPLGMTFERNLAIAGGMAGAGYGIGDQFGAGAQDRANLAPGAQGEFMKGSIGEAQRIVMGVSRIAGLDDQAGIENLIKLLQQYGETMAGAETFMTRLNHDTQAAGISTTKYIKLLDEVNGSFDKMTRNLDETVGIMRQLTRYGSLSSETLKDLMEGLLQKGPGAGMGEAALGAYSQTLVQGSPQLAAAQRAEKGQIMNYANNLQSELTRAGFKPDQIDKIKDMISKNDFAGAQRQANLLGGDVMNIKDKQTRQTALDALNKLQTQIPIAANMMSKSPLERSLGIAAQGGPTAVQKALQNFGLLNQIRRSTGLSMTDLAQGRGGEQAKGMIGGLDELFKQMGFPSFMEGARRIGQGRVHEVEGMAPDSAEQKRGYKNLATEFFKLSKTKNGIPMQFAEGGEFAKYWRGNLDKSLDAMEAAPEGIKQLHDTLMENSETMGSTDNAQKEIIDAMGESNKTSDEDLANNLKIAKEAGMRTQTVSDILKNIFVPLLSSISEGVEYIATALSKSKLFGAGDPQRMSKDMADVGKAIGTMEAEQNAILEKREALEQKRQRGGKLTPEEQRTYDDLTKQYNTLTDSIESFAKVQSQGAILSTDQMENVEKALTDISSGKKGVKIATDMSLTDPMFQKHAMTWKDALMNPEAFGQKSGEATRDAIAVAYHYYFGSTQQDFVPAGTANSSADSNPVTPTPQYPVGKK